MWTSKVFEFPNQTDKAALLRRSFVLNYENDFCRHQQPNRILVIVLLFILAWLHGYIYTRRAKWFVSLGSFSSHFKTRLIFRQLVTLVSSLWVIAQPLRWRLAPLWERSEETAWSDMSVATTSVHVLFLRYCTPVSHLSHVTLNLKQVYRVQDPYYDADPNFCFKAFRDP